MVRVGGRSKAWKLRGAGFNKLRKTECAISAGYWGFERRRPKVGCEGGNQRPTSTCLEVWPQALGRNFSLRLPSAPLTGMCFQKEQSHPSVAPFKAFSLTWRLRARPLSWATSMGAFTMLPPAGSVHQLKVLHALLEFLLHKVD